MKKIRRVKGELQRRVERLVKAGGFMNSGGSVGVALDGTLQNPQFGCYILGATLFGVKRRDWYTTDAAKVLGITGIEADAIERGYMDHEPENEWEQLGADLRAMYYGGEGL